MAAQQGNHQAATLHGSIHQLNSLPYGQVRFIDRPRILSCIKASLSNIVFPIIGAVSLSVIYHGSLLGLLEILVLFRLLTSLKFGLLLPLLICHWWGQLDIHGPALLLTTWSAHCRLSMMLIELMSGTSAKYLLDVRKSTLSCDRVTTIIRGQAIGRITWVIKTRLSLDTYPTGSVAWDWRSGRWPAGWNLWTRNVGGYCWIYHRLRRWRRLPWENSDLESR